MNHSLFQICFQFQMSVRKTGRANKNSKPQPKIKREMPAQRFIAQLETEEIQQRVDTSGKGRSGKGSSKGRNMQPGFMAY